MELFLKEAFERGFDQNSSNKEEDEPEHEKS